MSKLGWVELETLSTEIAHLQSRIDAARASKNYGTVRLLEREMAEVAERRGRVLADITNEFSEAPTDASSNRQILRPRELKERAKRLTKHEKQGRTSRPRV